MKLGEIVVFPSRVMQLVSTPIPGISTGQNISNWSERYAFATITGTKSELQKLVDLELASVFDEDAGYIEAPVTEDFIRRLEDSDSLEDKDEAIERLRSVV